MATSLVIGWWILLGDEFQQLGRHVLGSALFFANFSFWSDSGYFDTIAESKPLLHLWSLAVEEQFYLAWPLLLMWARIPTRMLKWIAILGAISLFIGIYWAKRYSAAAFYLPFGRGWELAVGAALAALNQQGLLSALSASACNRLSSAGLACIGLSLFVIDRNTMFPGYWALLPVVGACLCIAGGPETWVNRALLASPALVAVGLISYPLYLWHWPLLVYARILQDGFADPPRAWRITAVVLAFFLAWLTYRAIERPIRRRQGGLVILFLTLSMGLLATAGALMWRGKLPPRSNDPAIRGIVSAGSDWIFPDELQSFQANGQFFEIVPGGPQHVLLIGDSHVEQYRSRALELAKNEPGRVATLLFATRGACPPIPRFMEPRDPECEKRREAGFELAKRSEVKAVILAGCWACYFDIGDATSLPTTNGPPPPDRFYYVDESGQQYYLRGGDGVARSLEALAATIQQLRALGKRVYLVLNIPVGGEFEPRVRLAVGKGANTKAPLMDARPDDRAMSRKLARGRLGEIAVLPVSPTVALSDSQRALHDQLMQLARANGAIPLDPQSVLCQPETGQCLRTDEQGDPIYKDGSHLRAQYVRKHATFLDQALLIDSGETR